MLIRTVGIVSRHTLRLQHGDSEIQGVSAGVENLLLGRAEARNSV